MVSTASASPTASTVIGYARVSTIGQTLAQQTAALTAAGAGKIFHDVMSGARDDRPGFTECVRYLREGDTLIVWRLDRLGRKVEARSYYARVVEEFPQSKYAGKAKSKLGGKTAVKAPAAAAVVDTKPENQ